MTDPTPTDTGFQAWRDELIRQDRADPDPPLREGGYIPPAGLCRRCGDTLPCPDHDTDPVATLDVRETGLDPDQEIRARAIALAIDALARVDLPLLPLPAPGPGAYLLDLQQVFTTLIRDGSRP